MIHNNKFRDLVDNVFKNIETREITEQLNNLFEKSQIIDNQSKRTGRYNDTRLFREFCNGKSLITIKKNQFNTFKSNKQFFQQKNNQETLSNKCNNPNKENINEKNRILDRTDKSETKQESKTVISSDGFMKKFLDINPKFYLQKFQNKDDHYSKAIFSYLSNVFNVAPSKEEMLKNIKLDIITKFNKEDYYKNYDYSIKYFKKSDADDVFSNNLDVSSNMLKIYGDIFNINIVLRKNNFIEFITKYNSKNATVILNNLLNHTEILMSKDRFIRGDILQEGLGVNKKFKENELIKQKLDILQNYAKMKNINIRKAGKTGKINVKKDELITLICNN